MFLYSLFDPKNISYVQAAKTSKRQLVHTLPLMAFLCSSHLQMKEDTPLPPSQNEPSLLKMGQIVENANVISFSPPAWAKNYFV